MDHQSQQSQRKAADSLMKIAATSGTGPAATSPIKYGQSISIACNRSQTKEPQRNETTSTCTKCVDSPCACVDRRGVDQSREAWKAKIDTLESEIHRYEDIIDGIELGSDSDVMRLLQQLRTRDIKQDAVKVPASKMPKPVQPRQEP